MVLPSLRDTSYLSLAYRGLDLRPLRGRCVSSEALGVLLQALGYYHVLSLVGVILCESLFQPILATLNYEEYDCLLPTSSDSLLNYKIARRLLFTSILPCFIIVFLNVYTIVVINRSRTFRAAVGSNKPGREKASRVDRGTVSLEAVSLVAFATLLSSSVTQVCDLCVRFQSFYYVELVMKTIQCITI